jgi:hypothetical protein
MLGLPEDDVEIRGLNEDDVPALIACVRRCFDLLHARGFFFGALPPGTAVSEGIRMQRSSTRRSLPTRSLRLRPKDGRCSSGSASCTSRREVTGTSG